MDERMKQHWKKVAEQADFERYNPAGLLDPPHLDRDTPSFMDLPIAVTAEDLKGADAVILGFPWEVGVHLGRNIWILEGPRPANPDAFVGRSGADEAPDYIRKHSTYYSINLSGGFLPEVSPDFRLVDHLKMMDYGNVDLDRSDVEVSAGRCIEKVSDIVKAGAVPLVMGGDHSVPYPVVRGISDSTDGKIGIIMFDSDYDNWYGGDSIPLDAGNWLYRIFDTCQAEPENTVMIGITGRGSSRNMQKLNEALGITTFTIGDVTRLGMTKVMERTLEVVTRGTDKVYVTLDVDSLDPAAFPAQKYPDPFGITIWQMQEALQMISLETKLAGFDMACMGPAYDYKGLGGQTAARFLVELLIGLALRRAKNDG